MTKAKHRDGEMEDHGMRTSEWDTTIKMKDRSRESEYEGRIGIGREKDGRMI